MQMSVKVEVWGPYALFSQPELKVERCSYSVMTPSAARGLLEAVYWHPGMKWRVDRIHVLNPIAFTGVRRNEMASKISARTVSAVMKGGRGELYLATSEDIQQRAATVLRDVHYVIEAHFDLTDKAAPGDNEGKFCDIIRRRLEKGQCYHQPCFGCREFPAHFKKWEGGEIVTAYPNEDQDLGLMLYDMDYSDPRNITPMFFRGRLQKGVLNVPEPESREVLR
ncbi:MAG: type I-C CRISPR-associated protein Cas5c [Oscillibacter sp.]|nr:type I-C CRISPR-associated protein Cas5c [Oscillibacter sp.]